jgi:uroporphyrinogen decarboxylase
MQKQTSLQRVLTTLGHREPDRVPLFLLVTMHGAKELGLGIREYFSRAEHVAEGQLRLRGKYRHDCLYGFFFAALEAEAWGGEVYYRDDGPPVSGEPPIGRLEEIRSLEPPRIEDAVSLHRVLEALRLMKERTGDEAPIIGVVMSPFSLPVMQLGFERYIELIYEQPDLFDHLMKINQEFCTSWANAQLAAGATAICYFDPISSPAIVPRELYRKTGFEAARATLAGIRGPTATHLASARSREIVDLLVQTGTAAIGIGEDDDLVELKAACRGKLSILGNLNGIEMRSWSPETATAKVKELIAALAPGGGFILSDQHGEIPWQVPDEVLLAISDAVHTWGTYPLRESEMP